MEKMEKRVGQKVIDETADTVCGILESNQVPYFLIIPDRYSSVKLISGGLTNPNSIAYILLQAINVVLNKNSNMEVTKAAEKE